MKLSGKIITSVVLIIYFFTIYTSCQKEISCVDCRDRNNPPTAIAGPDQVITLPTDSILLDGSSSSDPDGTISEWRWTKIAGPASFTIANPATAKTNVKDLDTGRYLFELRVKDNGGLSAKDTVQVVVNDPTQPNQPPVANAGPDQTIVLPTNTIDLDGGGSTDPDNNIDNYLWTKISGPASFNIINANAIQTQIINLVEGIYQFELKVTDTGGLIAKDTATIEVRGNFGGGDCTGIPVSVVSGPGTLTPFGSLSQARSVAPVTAANKIVFGGGQIEGGSHTNRVDIYNLSTDTWSIAALSQPGSYSITVGNKIFFGTNTGFDIYDAASNTWSLLSVDQGIFQRGPMITVADNKVFFAGGLISNDSASSRVDIYDVVANTWSTAMLSEARTGINAITVANKVFFAGGYKKWNPIDYPDEPSARVDIYDISANTWSFVDLTHPAFGGYAAAIDNKVFFTFENIPDHVAVYDINTNSWSTAPLSVPRLLTRPIVVGNKLLLAGDHKYTASDRIDIYDATTNSWSIANLAHPGFILSFATLGNKVLMHTYSTGHPYQWSIYDASGNTVSEIEFNYVMAFKPITANNQIFLGGGFVRTGIGSNGYQLTSCVWKFQF